MRFWFSGPRFMGVRPGVSFSPSDLYGKTRQNSPGARIEGAFVYVVRGDHNMVKVGVTTNPAARLAQLRTGSAFPIDYAFVGHTPGVGYDVEEHAHRLLGQHRVNGEWFDVSPELAISAVMGAAGKLGQQLRPVDPTQPFAMSAVEPLRPPLNPLVFMLKWILHSVMMFIGLAFVFAVIGGGETLPAVTLAIPFLAGWTAFRSSR